MTRMTQKRLGKFQGPINDSFIFKDLKLLTTDNASQQIDLLLFDAAPNRSKII